MALAKRFAELRKGIRPHLELLKVFQEHGAGASAVESVDVLARLKKTRDEVVASSTSGSRAGQSQRQLLQQWNRETTQHEGFQQLWKRLLEAEGKEGLVGLPSSALSRTYNQLCRMNLRKEAEEVWSTVHSRVVAGKMADPRELLGVWSVAPEEHLAELDAPLAKAMGTREPLTWQLISAFSRVAERPHSKTVLWCSQRLEAQLQDLASEDLAMVLSMLRRPGAEGGLPEALRKLAREAKVELVSRDGALEPAQLVMLLESVEGHDDELWPMLRRQLLARKEDLTARQILEACSFLHRLPMAGHDAEINLFKALTAQLRRLLHNRSDPALVGLMVRYLDALASDLPTCQSVLNAAVRMKRDLYPAVLWKVFLSSSEADLVGQHPALQSRLQNIGEVLEQKAVKNMPLSEMRQAAAAMRRNNVPLPKSAEEMARHFLEVLERSKEAAGNADTAAKADESGGETTNWVGESQRFLVGFWADTKALGITTSADLAEAISAFSSPGERCKIEAQGLVECAEDLGALVAEDAQATEIQKGLISHLEKQLPSLGQRPLVQAANQATTISLQEVLIREIGRRFQQGKVAETADAAESAFAVKNGADLEDLISLLERFALWRSEGSEAAASADIVLRSMDLAAEALPGFMDQEPELAHDRLLAVVKVFASLGGHGEAHIAQLTRALHRLSVPRLGLDGAAAARPGTPATAAGLAYGYAALHGGAPPLDVAARLWRLSGSALEAAAHAEGHKRIGPEALVAAIGSGAGNTAAAELWTFGLTMRHLASASALSGLRLLPEAEALEACLQHLERRPEAARFSLEQEVDASRMVARLRSALPQVVAAGEPLEERFAVPGTPFVSDMALTGRGVLLLVPRSMHRAPDGGVSARGRLMERVLEACGWQLCWVWPEAHGGLESEEPMPLESLQALLDSRLASSTASSDEDAVDKEQTRPIEASVER